MQVNSIMQQGSWLILDLANPREAGKIIDGFRAGEYELKRKKQARSLDANAYSWVLIHKVAEKVRDAPVDVYRRYVRDVGQKTVISCVREEDTDIEIRTFLDNHIGRSVDVGDSKLPGCVTLHKHYGSSDYDSSQMAAFIDLIAQDCKDLGIETRPAEEIESLLQSWGKKHE